MAQPLAFNSVFTWTLIASGTVPAHSFITPAGAVAAADAYALGATRADVGAGEAVTVGIGGYVEMVAPEPLAVGTQVYSDANGQPTATGTNNPVGVVIKPAAAIGNVVGLILKGA